MERDGVEGERERLQRAESLAVGGERTTPQDSSKVEEECDVTKIAFLPFDFFSGEGGRGAEFAISVEGEEVCGRSQQPAVSTQEQKSFIFCSPALSIDGEHQIASQRTHFSSEIAQSKSFPSLFAAEHGRVRCLDLSLKLPHSFGASAAAEDCAGDAQEEILENSANACRKSPLKATPSEGNSRDSSKLVSCPCSITLLAGFAERTDMDHSRMQKQMFAGVQLSDQNQSQETVGSGHGDGLGIASGENRNDRELGISWSCPMTKLSSSTANTNATAQILTAFPGALSLALPRGFVTEIDSEVDSQGQDMPGSLSERGGKNVSDIGLKVVPTSAYCLESSLCDNFGAEMIIGKIETDPNLIGRINIRSTSKSEEVDAMSEAGELENGSDEEAALALQIDVTAEAQANAKVASHGALDLLVSAIQATSGSLFREEEDNVSGRLKKGKFERESENDLLFWTKEACAFVERTPMVKKKVLRRARSAFKKSPLGESNLELIKGENSEVVDDLPALKRGRKGRGSAAELHETQDDARSDLKRGQDLAEVEAVMDGTPVIRSKRGRSQALPTKFFDSVLQPWKRKSRRRHK